MATSSARYSDLYDYARVGEQIDQDLLSQGDRLTSRLSHFEATCREGGFRVGSDGLGDGLRAFAEGCLSVEAFVRKVGEAFQRADNFPWWIVTLPSFPMPSPIFRLWPIIRWREPVGAIVDPIVRIFPLPWRSWLPIVRWPRPFPPRWHSRRPWFPRPPWQRWPDVGIMPILPGVPPWVVVPFIIAPWILKPGQEARPTPQPGPVPSQPVSKSDETTTEKESPFGKTGLDNSTKSSKKPVSDAKNQLENLFKGIETSVSGGAHKNDDSRGIALDIIPKDNQNVPIVHALRGGTVVGVGYEKGGYGNYIKVLQDDGKVVLYAHLAEPPALKNGDPVDAGAELANMGDTGRSTGTHLHIEFRQPTFDKSGKYAGDSSDLADKWDKGDFDPLDYLREQGLPL